MKMFKGYLFVFVIISIILGVLSAKPCDEAVSNPDFFPFPGNCSKYITCLDGKKYENECPKGEYFDKESKKCGKDRDIGCDCPLEGIAAVSIPKICHKYVFCIEGDGYELECAEGLSFDEEFQDCVLEEESKCVVNPCSDNPKPGLLELHPSRNNCNEYIMCVKGEPVFRNCSSGTVFDPVLLKCIIGTECISTNPTTVPTESTLPIETTEPTVSTEDTEEPEPSEPTETTEETKTTTSIETTETIEEPEPSEPPETTEETETTESIETTETIEETEPTEPTEVSELSILPSKVHRTFSSNLFNKSRSEEKPFMFWFI